MTSSFQPGWLIMEYLPLSARLPYSVVIGIAILGLFGEWREFELRSLYMHSNLPYPRSHPLILKGAISTNLSFCMIIRESGTDNGNNVKWEPCDKRFCYMLIQNWLQLSKLHQSLSQEKQLPGIGSDEATVVYVPPTQWWTEIREDS